MATGVTGLTQVHAKPPVMQSAETAAESLLFLSFLSLSVGERVTFERWLLPHQVRTKARWKAKRLRD